jgi:hypothetical protein
MIALKIININDAVAIPVPRQIRNVAKYIGCLEIEYTPV